MEGVDPDGVGAVVSDDEDGGAKTVRGVEVADGADLEVRERASDNDERETVGVLVGEDVRDVEPVEGLNHIEHPVSLAVREERR